MKSKGSEVMKKVWFFALLLFVLIGCQDRGTPARDISGDCTALQRNSLYRYFARTYPGKDALMWALKDVDSDGKDDLVLIYKVSKEKNAMRVVLTGSGTYAITNDVPAPVLDQVITFKDIDGKPPMEFIVQGMKETKIGYAVYRIERGKLVDLFSEGMDECC
jgi:hypothetical protein